MEIGSETPDPVRPILLVDDNTEDLFFLRRKLAKIGVSSPIVSVEDGFEAIRLLKACGRNGDGKSLVPSVVFLDINMPGVTGFSVLSWVRSQDSLNVLRVVMVSDSGEPCDIELATELGANAYLIKYPTSESIAHVLACLDPSIMMGVPAPREGGTNSPLARGYAIPLNQPRVQAGLPARSEAASPINVAAR